MIALEGVSVALGGRPVLCRVDLTVQPGEVVALVGANGCGKSTLLRAVMGFLPTAGTVRVGGHDPRREHAAAMRHVAFVPQRSPALAATVSEVRAFWARSRGLDPLQLDEMAGAFGLDLGTLAPLPFTALSGGMQQKLLAAMALATGCPLLVCDEPTANLDRAAREVFYDRLRARCPAPTVLMTSHRGEEVEQVAHRVVELADGVVTWDGAVAPIRRARP
jgi:ABC-type multidrug transport system ATPase subunit